MEPAVTRVLIVPVVAGVAGYFVGLFSLIAVSGPTSDGEIFLALSQNWGWAGLIGFLATIAGLVWVHCRPPQRGKILWWPAPSAFAVPFLTTWLLTRVFSRVDPSLAYDYELSFGAILTVLLLLAGLISLGLRKRTLADTWGAWVAIPVLGLLMVAGWFSWHILASNDFVYRDAFEIHHLQMDRDEHSVTVRAVLKLGKSGPFQYEATSYWLPVDEGDGKALARIQWENGDPPTEAGEYPFIITWANLPPEIVGTLGLEDIPDSSLGLSVVKKSGDPQKREMIRYLSLAAPAE